MGDVPRKHSAKGHNCPCHCDVPACILYGDCCPDVYAKLGYKPQTGYDIGIAECRIANFGHIRSPKEISEVS